MKKRVIIDGSMGEGGGQVLRTSLALSLVTGKPFRIENIRAGRKRPGLLNQHLTAVNAAARISSGRIGGAELESTELAFTPGEVVPGEYTFSVGTAGSSTLVLQAVLPALATASGPSTLTLEGGTHNPFAPPFDFLKSAFLPLLCRMGPRVTCRLNRHGFFPAGGGRFTVRIDPAGKLKTLDLLKRGEVVSKRARALVSRIPERVGHRELKVVEEKAGWGRECLEVVTVPDSRGPGNVLSLELSCEEVAEVFTAFGEKGVPAERVAEGAVDEMLRYLAAGVPVGKYLADQILVPMAIAGGGAFKTLAPTRHTLTNMDVIRKFLDVEITSESLGHDAWEIRVTGEKGSS